MSLLGLVSFHGVMAYFVVLLACVEVPEATVAGRASELKAFGASTWT